MNAPAVSPRMGDPMDISRRQRLLLELLSTSDGETLDPIRIMKAEFLLSMEAPNSLLSDQDKYQFEPYNYGPYSVDVYRDLDRLGLFGFLSSSRVPGRNWNRYAASEMGRREAQKLRGDISPKLLDFIGELRNFVIGNSFESLLRSVYSKYPDYAAKSVFRGMEG